MAAGGRCARARPSPAPVPVPCGALAQEACEIAAAALREHSGLLGRQLGAMDAAALKAASALVQEAIQRGTQDNVTAIVIVPLW